MLKESGQFNAKYAEKTNIKQENEVKVVGPEEESDKVEKIYAKNGENDEGGTTREKGIEGILQKKIRDIQQEA